ncbi:MAG: hypothetical protein EB072_18990, partial [Betaproteobacteria bacterium]|nr:hypothetical protein [Betaproteobacteria bacterium]
ILGLGGNDSLLGNTGNDSIEGRAGNDTLVGGEGNDVLLGGRGGDRFLPGAGSDVIDAGGQGWLPWTPSNPDDYDVLDYTTTAGVNINLSARSVSVTGESGTDLYLGIEEIQGAANAKDTITGRLTESAADVLEGGHAMNLLLRGGSDLISYQAQTAQQTWSHGVYVRYNWSLTPIQLTYVGNSAEVSYAASGGQLAGTDTLVNVSVIGDTAYNDRFDLKLATNNQFGYITDQRTGKSSHALLLGSGGSDTVEGNGLTQIQFGAVTTTNNPDGVSGALIDLKQGTANLSHLSSNGMALGTVTFSGVRGLVGTRFNDTLVGGLAANDPFENFRPEGGNDFIDGGSGYDRAEYRYANDGISVNLAAGLVSSPSQGTDTLRSIEAIRGSMFADFIDARGFIGGSSSATSNVGSFWWNWNEMTPDGGNDTIMGNGATYLIYAEVMVPIRVDLAAGYADARIGADRDTQAYLTVGR